MLELSRPDLAVVRCCARHAEIDELARPEMCGRIAPDEILVLAPTSDSERVLAELSTELGRANPSAIVIDHSDAFHLIALAGRAHEALARLSPVPIPSEGFVQGPVAGVPCKIFVTSHEILLLAPSTYGHHLRERIMVACADLDVRERAFTEPASLAQAASA